MKKIRQKLKVLVVDDHPIIHEGLEQMLNREEDMEVCGNAQSVNQGIAQVEKLKPDFIIAYVTLKGGVSGLELVKAVKTRYPNIKILVLSMHDENLYAERAVKAGANGYLMKEELRNTIVDAIRQIMGGKLYLSERIVSKFLDNFLFETTKDSEVNIDKLSDREFEIFQLISKGYKTGEISKMLNVSTKTIGTHKFRIQEKLNLKNSGELTKLAIEWSQQNK